MRHLFKLLAAAAVAASPALAQNNDVGVFDQSGDLIGFDGNAGITPGLAQTARDLQLDTSSPLVGQPVFFIDGQTQMGTVAGITVAADGRQRVVALLRGEGAFFGVGFRQAYYIMRAQQPLSPPFIAAAEAADFAEFLDRAAAN